MTQFPKKGLFKSVPEGAFAARNATLTGDVKLAEDVGVWFGCVLRGDDAPLSVGRRSNIQDLTMVHADTGVSNEIGEEVTVGHRCVLHGAVVGDRCLIGMGAVLLGGSKIGAESIIAAGAVVTRDIPPNSIAAGVPARVLRQIDERDRLHVWEKYVKNELPNAQR